MGTDSCALACVLCAPGSEHERQHRERYTVHLRARKGTWDCDFDEARRRSYAVGAQLPLKVRVVVGSAVCDSLGRP